MATSGRNSRTGEVGPVVVKNVAPDLNTKDTSGTLGAPEADAPSPAYAYDPDSLEEKVVTEEDIVTYLPTDRIPAGEVIYIRNNTNSVVRFVDSPKPSEATFNLLLDPAGQPGSINSLETFGILRNPGFQRWWKAGKLTVTSGQSISPLPVDIGRIELERHQQFALEGTLERTAKGSLPIHKGIDMSFLDAQKKR